MNKQKQPRRRILGKFDGQKYGWLQYNKFVVILIIILFIAFRFVIGFSFISGSSMNNTLYEGELVLYLRIVPEYQEGDIVSIHVPSGDYYIKRVIGVPGDVIDIQNGQLYVNGIAENESYVLGETLLETSPVSYPYTVQEDDLFVLGDNREVSIDSRSFGAINKRQVRGKILLHMGRWYVRLMK